MKLCTWISCSLLVAALASCRSAGPWSAEDALTADMIELRVDGKGAVQEIEYHLPPGEAPEAVRAAMNELYPGAAHLAAEKELEGGVLYWELSVAVGGREAEAMFLPDGTLHAEEIEVDVAAVPAVVRETATARVPGTVTGWEEVRDGRRELVEYHVKTDAAGIHYKGRIGLGGELLGLLREVPAEIEVPLE